MFKLKDRVKRIGEQEVFTVENIHEPDEHVLGLNPAAEFNLARTLLRDWSLRKANLSWRNDRRKDHDLACACRCHCRDQRLQLTIAF